MTAGATYLVADIGGTNARFAAAQGSVRSGFALANVRRLKVEDFPTLHAAAESYLEDWDGEPPTEACFAVAGPVDGDDISLTNSPWRLRPRALAADLGLTRLRAVNDFAAQARGALLTPADDVVEIASGTPHPGAPIAVLGPGTGLGLGLLVPDDDGMQVVATEGGHVAFAPQDDREREVWDLAHREHGFVSYERVLSGEGLETVHRALDAAGARLEAEAITAAAKADPASPAARALDVFFAVLGTFAGDAIVMTGARGGLYLAGGILPKVADLLRASRFLARLHDRGPMSGYVTEVPVRLVLSDDAALLGAAALAEEATRG